MRMACGWRVHDMHMHMCMHMSHVMSCSAWRMHLSRLAQPRTNRHAHLVRASAKVRVRVREKVEARASARVRVSCCLCCKRAGALYKALV